MIHISDSESDTVMADATEPDTIYEVEKIVDHRRSSRNENQVQYLIKWKGYKEKHNTWEDEKNVQVSHLSPGLVSEYWRRQPYTLSEFKNKTHVKKQPVYKIDRKQLEKEIRAASLTAIPPTGLVWSDMEAILNVFLAEPNSYFAEIKWKGYAKHTFMPTRIIKKHNALKLLEFYERKVEYLIPTAGEN